MRATKLFLLHIALLCLVRAQLILSPGDVVIIGVNCDNPDDFAFLVTVDIPPGTEIKFTDNGIKSDGTFRDTEGTLTYIVPSNLSAGTVIVYSENQSDFSGQIALSASGDQLIVYQENGDENIFIYGVNIEGSATWQDSASSSNTSALPPGLENGYTAVALREYDNVKYNGETNFPSREAALISVSNKDNWVGNNSLRYDFSNFNDFSLPVIFSKVYGEFHEWTIKLFWETESEPDIIGFNVYRSDTPQDSFNIVNAKLIEACGNICQGAKYEYIDRNILPGKRYFYKVGAVDLFGTERKTSPIEVLTEPPLSLKDFHLTAIYPNPTNGQFVILLLLHRYDELKITLYDCFGREISPPLLRALQPGFNSITFHMGENLPSGIYICRITSSGGYYQTKKLVYIK